MSRPVLKQNSCSLNFSVYHSQPGRGVQLQWYFTFFQAEPKARAIRGTYEIEKIKMPESKNVLETELCMFVDDTQLFNKNEESGF